MRAHTLEEARARFTLVKGVGDGQKTACVASLLAWVDGCDRWTDAPECGHRLIREHIVAANDAEGTTEEMKWALAEVGLDGFLDTWWVPDSVVAWSLASEKDQPRPGTYDVALSMVQRIAQWKINKPHANLMDANLRDANLGGANLRGANLRGANLRDAILTHANLRGANLTHANLRDANLMGANLGGANLRDAILTGAILTDANLMGADLTGAILTGADLRGADLTGAILTGANLMDANLTGANLTGANLGGANLRDAILTGANLTGANLMGANLTDATSWLPARYEVVNGRVALKANA